MRKKYKFYWPYKQGFSLDSTQTVSCPFVIFVSYFYSFCDSNVYSYIQAIRSWAHLRIWSERPVWFRQFRSFVASRCRKQEQHAKVYADANLFFGGERFFAGVFQSDAHQKR